MYENYSKDQWVTRGLDMIQTRQKKIDIAKKRKFDTIATTGIYDFHQAQSQNNASIMEPIYLSPAQGYCNSAELETSLAYEMPSWCYSRIANPSNFFLEETIALLETYGSDIQATCLSTSSGMSAIRTATDPFLVYDDTYSKPNIVSTSKLYGGTFQQLSVRRWQEQKIEIRWITNPLDLGEWERNIDDNTRFVYGEFPSNPSLSIFDIEKVAQLSHAHSAPLIIDATCASPALTRPLIHGTDIVIHSASKVLGASGYTIAGVITASKNIISKIGCDEMKHDFCSWVHLWPFRDNGPCLSPIAAIMLLNDVRSLRSRVSIMSENALIVARHLEKHPKVARVHYPGLESFPAHAIAKKYMKLADTTKNMYGFMLTIELAESNPMENTNARKFYDSLQLLWRATDLGRVKSVATLNAISTHQQQGEEGRKLAGISPSTCRISIGIEDVNDIVDDIEQALKKI